MKKDNNVNHKKFIIAQTCDSRKCRNDYKEDIIKNVVEAVTTPHVINFSTKEIKCQYCGKITKLKSN